MIEIRHLKKVFGTKEVLSDVNLKIEEGKITYILGLSGQGKSTIIKHIVGLLEPTSGEIIIDNEILNLKDRKKLFQIRKKIGFTFQDSALFDSMNIYENLEFPLNEHTKLSKIEKKDLIINTLSKVGLEEHILSLYPHELSGGMRKRVAVARAIILKPKYVLFDEPTSGLDPIISDKITEVITNLTRKYSITTVVISHDLKETFKSADYIAMLFKGKIIEYASRDKFKKSKNKIVRAFINGDSKLFEKIEKI